MLYNLGQHRYFVDMTGKPKLINKIPKHGTDLRFKKM